MASPFGINVVSRSHRVSCGACAGTASRVAETCPSCGASFADAGFSIVPAADRSENRPTRQRLTLRKAPAA